MSTIDSADLENLGAAQARAGAGAGDVREAVTPRMDGDPLSVGSGGWFGRYERMIAWRYLRARRRYGGVALISIISFLGIMLAVAVLIIVMSVMNGFRDTLLSTILGVEAHAYISSSDLSPETMDLVSTRVQRVDGVTRVSAVVQGQAMVSAYDFVNGAVVFGVSREDLEQITLVADSVLRPGGRGSGSFDEFGEGRNGGDKIVVGRGLANSLAVGVGDYITLVSPSGSTTALGTAPRRKSYQIAATFFVGNTNYDSQIAFLPFNQAQLFFGRGDEVDYLEVRVEEPDHIENVLDDIVEAARPYARVHDWRDRQGAFFNALQVERFMMRLILMLIVLIAALNIISGLVMLAKNKSRDIAILRTIGATQGGILRIFFLAGAIIGVSGTLAGLALGVLFCLNIEAIQKFVEWVTQTQVFSPEVYMLSSLPAKIEWSEVIIVTLAGLIASCLATLPPAWRAARLDPVEALRYE